MRLRRFEELIIPDVTAALLVSMSAAMMDRRLGPDRTGPTTPSMPGFLRREWFSGSGDMNSMWRYRRFCVIACDKVHAIADGMYCRLVMIHLRPVTMLWP